MAARKTTTLTKERIISVLDDHEERIDELEKKNIGTEAVANYLLKHPAQTVSENKLNKDLVKVVLTFLGVATAAIYLAQDILKALLK